MSLVAQSNRPAATFATNNSAGPLRHLRFDALGTVCAVQFVCAEDADAREFERATIAWVAAFEARYSRFRPDSIVSRINAAAGTAWVDVDEEMDQMLNFCASLYFLSSGVLDVTALPLLRLWDFRAAEPVLPSTQAMTAAKDLVGWSKVQRAPGRVFLPMAGMAIDFGGWGKEFAVDAVAQLATAHGISAALVDFGHDLRAVGVPPERPAWHIGLENPAAPGTCWGSIGVTNRGIASSGDYLRGVTIGGRRYGHIIDPRTGWPVANGCTQVTVIASSCVQAGMLSTAAFVLGPDAGRRLIEDTFGAEGCLLTVRGRAQTRGFINYLADEN